MGSGNDIRRSGNGRGGKTNSILLINGESVENLWKNSSLKALQTKGFKRIMRELLVRANFALTDTLPLKNGSFLIKISLF